MEKNCLGCKTKHVPPFGVRCSNMAVVEGFKRNDQAYLVFLEQDYTRRKIEDEHRTKQEPGATAPVPHLTDVLKEIKDRLGNLEKIVPQANLNPSTADYAGKTVADLLADPLTQARWRALMTKRVSS